MRRPTSITAAAGGAGLTSLLVLLWTTMDFAIGSGPAPRPPAPPEGVSTREWERVLASPAPSPEPDTFTNLDLLALVFDGLSIALPVAGIVLWVGVGIAAVRGSARSRSVAVVVAATQGILLPVHATGSAPEVLAVTWAVVGAGAAVVVLLSRAESVAYLTTRSERSDSTALSAAQQ